MGRRSPYRAGKCTVSVPRSLSFFHGRLLLLIAIAVPFAGFSLWALTTPRTVVLECAAPANLELSCRATTTSWWNKQDSRTRVQLDEARPHAIGEKGAERYPFRQIQLEVDYQRQKRTSVYQRVIARDELGAPKELTPWLPEADADLIQLTDALQENLRRGQPGRLEYQTTWTGLISAAGLAFLVIAFVWIRSGRTRVRLDPEQARVEIESRAFWFTKPSRRDIALTDIAAVVVARAPGIQNANVYLPAFRLQSGELLRLGESGLGTPVRAEHWAKLLRELLDIPNSENSSSSEDE